MLQETADNVGSSPARWAKSANPGPLSTRPTGADLVQRIPNETQWAGEKFPGPSFFLVKLTFRSRRYWRRLFQAPQGERAEATAFWQALPARIAPQTHRTRPVNCGRER